jgi:hypothetical protein
MAKNESLKSLGKADDDAIGGRLKQPACDWWKTEEASL